MVQVALRHPDLQTNNVSTARIAERFVRDVQHHYRAFETLHRLIELGFTMDAPPC
jgi:hypothetical protein